MTETYEDMVARLVKPGKEILETLTPEKVHLLHMAVGMAGEVAEMLGAISPGIDMNNMEEELGDYIFYSTGAWQGLERVPSEYEASKHLNTSPTVAHRLVSVAYKRTGGFLDLVKKVTVYNKATDEDVLAKALEEADLAVFALAYTLGFNLDNLKKKNQEKLSTGKNARYKEGYTDQAAQERADKQEQGGPDYGDGPEFEGWTDRAAQSPVVEREEPKTPRKTKAPKKATEEVWT